MALEYTPIDALPEIVEGLRESFNAGKTRDLAFRRQQLQLLAYLLDENREAFKDAFKKDMGRPWFETFVGDIDSSISDITALQANLYKFAAPQKAPGGVAWGFSEPHFKREARGLCYIAGPYNYPILCLLVPAAGAIAAGNTCLLKPSECCPTIAALLTRLWPKYMDTTCYKIVNGDGPVSEATLKNRFDFIFFTGGTAVARKISEAALKYLTPVGLELGGTCPAIVDETCDIDLAGKRIAWAKSFNSGQTCVAPNHVLVMESVKDRLVAAIKKHWHTQYPEGSTDQAKMVNERHFSRITGMLDKTNGDIVHGNKRSGNQLSVTLVDNVKTDDSLLSDELFGPCLPIVTIRSIDEAIQITNDMGTPLAIYVFSNSKETKKQVSDNTRSGSVIVNHCIVQMQAPLPFSSVGTSGNTGYRGRDGLNTFCTFSYERTYLKVPFFLESSLANIYPPYNSQWKFKMATMLTLNKINFPKPGTGSFKWRLWRLLTSKSLLLTLALLIPLIAYQKRVQA